MSRTCLRNLLHFMFLVRETSAKNADTARAVLLLQQAPNIMWCSRRDPLVETAVFYRGTLCCWINGMPRLVLPVTAQ